MNISEIDEVEIADLKIGNDYDRIKLHIAFDNDKERKAVWENIVKPQLSKKDIEESEVSEEELCAGMMVLAFVHYNHKKQKAEVFEDLLSVYVYDIGELKFPNKDLKPHAFERCLDFVDELYAKHTLVEIYAINSIFSDFSRGKDNWTLANEKADEIRATFYGVEVA